MRQAILIIALVVLAGTANAEKLTQTIRGRVFDNESKSPLPGANVVLAGSDPIIGTITDLDGNFKLSDIPVGRHTLWVSFIGYERAELRDLLIGSAKEVILTVPLEESLENIGEVVVRPGNRKGNPKNEMACVSARSFTVEETKRYPAAICDPGRLALVFPGVTVGTEDASNEIVIRGNSSNGMLWRMEGVEIPNPNHYSVEGSSTGFVSILSSNMLSKSDFFTGAFPGEFGNALSGVFDISLRNGNDEKHEYSCQMGVLGTDLTVEGPFSKNYNGSYLANFRYSTMDLLTKLGLDIGGDMMMNYMDLSYKLHFPTKKAGNFSVWGIGGPCYAVEKPRADTAKLYNSPSSRAHHVYNGSMMAGGITHVWFPDDRSYLRTIISYSANGSIDEDSLVVAPYEDHVSVLEHKQDIQCSSLRSSVMYNHKVSKRFSLRAGGIFSHLMYDYDDRDYFVAGKIKFDASGSSNLIQSYIQGKYKIQENLTFNAGLHYMHFYLNGANSVEPRLGLQWKITPNQSLAFGFGKHSRLELLSTYFTMVPLSDSTYSQPNISLDLTKARHYVCSYDCNLTSNMHFKAEVYYQKLYDVPVRTNPSYIAIPMNNRFPKDTLVNNGIARNYGLELLLEKYFSDGYYFLATASFFDSKLNPAFTDKWYNTKFNTRFIRNFVGGKEFKTGRNKQNLLGVNAKILWSGGKRGPRVDEKEGIVYKDDRYEAQYEDYFRIDAGVYIRINRSKTAHVISFDVQNLTNRKNILGKTYNPETGMYAEKYMTGFVPVFNYRIEF